MENDDAETSLMMSVDEIEEGGKRPRESATPRAAKRRRVAAPPTEARRRGVARTKVVVTQLSRKELRARGVSELQREAERIRMVLENDDDHDDGKKKEALGVVESVLRAETAKEEANELFKKGQYVEALQGYGTAIKEDPSCATYFANRGAANLMLNRFVPASLDCEKAIELDQAHLRAHLRLAKAQLSLGDVIASLKTLDKVADLTRKASPSEEASGIVKEACEMSQLARDLQGHLSSAKNFLLLEETTMASSSIGSAILIAPASIRARGLQVAITLAKGRKTAVSQLGGDTLNAFLTEYLPGLTKKQSQIVEETCWLGNLLVSLGFYVEASKCFRMALENEPSNLSARCSMKLLYEIQDIQSSTQGTDDDRIHCLSSILGLIQNSRHQEASAAIISRGSLISRILFERAGEFIKKGKFQSAFDDCTQALEQMPSFTRLYQRRAQASISLGGVKNLQSAIRDLESGRADANKIEQAKEWLRKARSLEEEATKKKPQPPPPSMNHSNNRHHFRQPPRDFQKENENPKSERSNKTCQAPIDCYKVLGLKPGATQSEIRKAYKQKALQLHPDKNSSPSAEDRFKRLGEAYRQLRD